MDSTAINGLLLFVRVHASGELVQFSIGGTLVLDVGAGVLFVAFVGGVWVLP